MSNKGINKKILIAGLGVGATIAAAARLAILTAKNKKKEEEHSGEHSGVDCPTCGCNDCSESDFNNEECKSCLFNPFSDEYIGDDDDYDFGNLKLNLSGSTFNFGSSPAFGSFDNVFGSYPTFSSNADKVFGTGAFGNPFLFGVAHKSKKSFLAGTETKIHCGLCEGFGAGEMTDAEEPNGFKAVFDENGALNCKGVCEVLAEKMSEQDNDIDCVINTIPGIKCVGKCGACKGVKTPRRSKKSEEE